jgi:hypothetical protein
MIVIGSSVVAVLFYGRATAAVAIIPASDYSARSVSHIGEYGDFARYDVVSGRFSICTIPFNHRLGWLLDTDGNLWGINFERLWRYDNKRLVLCDFELD